MKRTDLEKLNGLKINGRLKATDTPQRFGAASLGERRGPATNPLIEKLLKKGLGKPSE